MNYRIYVDESGTHSDEWLVIGMLFVPSHGPLHSALCGAKDSHGYLNTSTKRSGKYKEIHLCKFKSYKDVHVAKDWIDLFLSHDCYFRAIVVDWSIFDGSYFGDPFEPHALQKRRAYKKWAEMLLQPELSSGRIVGAKLYLDRLRIMYGYDVLGHLQDRFTANYKGSSPFIEEFQQTDSAKDANQCLQLCDLLTGCLFQSLVRSTNIEKGQVRDHLSESLKKFGVKEMAPRFWKGFAPTTLTKHFSKFSAWFWRPNNDLRRRKI
jgi:hypothetical protein